MIARDVMTLNPYCCWMTDTVQEVARLMRDHDCGSVPVVDADSDRLVGIVTDRDIAVRGIANGRLAGTRIAELMTAKPSCCGPDDDIREVERAMAENQVRRVPIVDAAGRCVGIVSQADLALSVDGRQISEHEVALTVERISLPKGPYERGARNFSESRV